jgi:hypothetical protein
MAVLPDDLLRWLDAHFSTADTPAGARLLRCAAALGGLCDCATSTTPFPNSHKPNG